MSDIVERLRRLAKEDPWQPRVEIVAQAADEIERLRAECQRLAGEVSRAHKNALTWMERAAAVNAEIEAARQQGRIEGATKLQAERDAARAEAREAAAICGIDKAEAAIRVLLEASDE